MGFATVPEYYWRDYYGLIPSDAIKAGTDENGQDTYVAQLTTVAEYNVGKTRLHTVPAVIKKGSKTAFAPYAGRVIHSNDTSNTKVSTVLIVGFMLFYIIGLSLYIYFITMSFNHRYCVATNTTTNGFLQEIPFHQTVGLSLVATKMAFPCSLVVQIITKKSW